MKIPKHLDGYTLFVAQEQRRKFENRARELDPSLVVPPIEVFYLWIVFSELSREREGASWKGLMGRMEEAMGEKASTINARGNRLDAFFDRFDELEHERKTRQRNPGIVLQGDRMSTEPGNL